MSELDLKAWLLWCRENRFDVHEIEAGGVRMVLRDLGEKPPPPAASPRTVHEAFAAELGIDYHEEDEADRPDPVEGVS